MRFAPSARRAVLSLLICGLAIPAARAQDPPADTPPADAPSPEAPVTPPSPRTLYDGSADTLATLHAHVTLREIGRSRAGRPLQVVTITRSGDEGHSVHWRALLVAGMSGLRDRTETRLALDVAAQLAERAADIPAGVAFDVLLDGNPDATAAAASGVRRVGNDTPTDEDQDGQVDEDGGEDLSGDGAVTFMRFPDPTGTLAVTPRESPSDEPERPEWADAAKGRLPTHRIVPEGRDSDDDGEWNEDGAGGVDLSRNFPWRFEELTPGRGRWAASEDETRALLDHLLADQRIAVVYEIGDAETLAQEPGYSDAWPKPPGGDLELYAAWRELHGKGVDGVKRAARAPEPGSLGGVVVHQLGRMYAGRAPLGVSGAPWPAPGAELPEHLAVKWTQLSVSGVPRGAEVGVIVPAPGKTAPGPWSAESDAAATFLLDLARGRPQLSFADTRVSGEPGVVKVRTQLVNGGRWPTHGERGAEVRGRRPVNVWLRAPDGCTLLGGAARVQIERLAGGATSDELKWVVKGPSGTTLRIEAIAPDAGTTTLEVRIP